ncbi:MAG: D-alanyl-D-alanine carboxypeptidase family protein [bacterium]|nr:D-alanyl-D-alanine carboxypeptidase family protein [bacterium]MDZ4248014.1 D-alanyl-D-alanine carboxypeptidase family protein [Patescibacteria group bacterium]
MDWLTQAVLAILVLAGSVVPGVVPESAPSVDAVHAGIEAPPVYPFPEKRSSAVAPVVGAKSALVTDLASGAELFEKDASTKRPIASITKLMTALLAVEELPSDREIVVPKLNNGPEESLMGLEEDDRVYAVDLLAGTLIVSGNDAAETLAIAVSGSEKKFVDLMNRRAEELGMGDTHFDNASGYGKGENVSSARDLVVLTRAALEKREIRNLAKDPERTVKALNKRKPTPENPDPERTEYRLFTTDLLLDSYLPIAGLKTGTSDAAGPSLVSVLDDGKRRLVAVVLNSPDRFQENKAMLDWSLRSFRW